MAAILTGVRTVAGHAELRSTVVLMVVSGAGLGCLTIGLPLWAQDGLHASPGAAGWMWAALSVGSIIGGVAYGWRRPPGSDARHVVAVHRALRHPAHGGAARRLRGRRSWSRCSRPASSRRRSSSRCSGSASASVEPYLHGRVFAITVSINAAGVPAGAFLAGLIVGPVGVHHLLYGAGLAQPLAAGLAAALMARRRSCPDGARLG